MAREYYAQKSTNTFELNKRRYQRMTRLSQLITKLFLLFCPFVIIYFRNSGCLVMCTKYLLCVDYDNDIQIAVSEIEQRVKKHPEETWYLYQTFQGVHAFLLSKKIKTAESDLYLKNLSCDSRWLPNSKEWKCWRTRISPKRGRQEKFIKVFLRRIGNGVISPELFFLLSMHNLFVSICEKFSSLSFFRLT